MKNELREPIKIEKFERLKKYDVAGGLAIDCDYIVGKFSRDEDWHFEIYFDDAPTNYTLSHTRISELYIKYCGDTQWMWSAPDEPNSLPDSENERELLQDLIHGIHHIDSLTEDDLKPYTSLADTIIEQVNEWNPKDGAGLN